MVKFAFRDQERKKIIRSNQVIEEDRNTRFYCPNPRCNAELYICAIDGSKNAYFRATKSNSKHDLKCPYGTSVSEFDSNNYDESTFVFDVAINNLLCATKTSSSTSGSTTHGTGEPGIHTVKTLRQMYALCKSLSVRDKYAGKEIGEMILDDRSQYRYPKGCFGNKLIEATVDGKIYDNKKKEVYLVAPINSKKYTFILSFSDETIYKTIRTEIYNNKDKIIVVAGKWQSSGTYNKFKSEIISKKQVAIIKS